MDWSAFSLAVFRASVFIGIVPLAGLRSQPAKIKAMISLALAVVLAPSCTLLLGAANSPGFVSLAARSIGQAVFFAALVMAIHELYAAITSIWSVQTGLSYSSVLDPTKESESTSLTSIVQLLFLLHFVNLDLHLELLGAGLSSDLLAPSASKEEILTQVAVLGKRFLASGLAWGLPYVALLLTVDLVLAFGAKLHEKFQATSYSNPLKQILLLLLLLFSLPLWRGETGPRIASILAR
jgi:flagellar biosynthetic protein FliR